VSLSVAGGVDGLSQVTRPAPAEPEREAFASCLIAIAHADDCDFSCSGTAAKWAAAGTEVSLVVLTDGSKGSHDLSLPDEQLVAAREDEQREAARILGFGEVGFLRYVDGELSRTDEAVAAMAHEIRRRRPEVVLTHDPWRRYMLHPDHRAAGEIVCDAVYRAGEPRFYRELTENGLPRWKPRELWLFSAEEPNHVEDITEWFARKVEAMLSYKSQFATALRIRKGDDGERIAFEDWFGRRFAAIGERHGVGFAEEFRRIRL
jgi:LmbE family N-acetylglucosaminyl deacetylase